MTLVTGQSPTEHSAVREKWIALHSFRSDPDTFKEQLSELVTKLGDMDVVYVQAPHAHRGPCPFGDSGFEWWSAPEDVSYMGGWIGKEGVQESIKYLESKVREEGPFAGVIGFSQGGGMAIDLLATGLVQKGILFSPVVPLGIDWPLTGTGVTKYNAVVFRDEVDPSFVGVPTEGMVQVLHSEQHAVPRMDDKMIETIRLLGL